MTCEPIGCQGQFTIPCNDDNPCTEDVCPNRTCTHVPTADGTSCHLGLCSTGGTCQSGLCTGGTPADCDDHNPCTVDACDPAVGCTHAPLNCDDGNLCTRDICDPGSGVCLHIASVDQCDDHNGCTADSCDPALGCQHIDACDDGNACTRDVCLPGTNQCIHTPADGTACDDGNPCTFGDTCGLDAAGRPVCVGTPEVPCGDDGDPCTDDFIDPATCECVHPPRSCDDDDPCTVDTCSASGCAHAPLACDDGDACTADSCDHATGACAHQPVSSPVSCGIGACRRTVDACAGGVPQECVPGQPSPEICNGVDDDCDGLVDENRIRASCVVMPRVVRVPPRGSSFDVVCTLKDACAGDVVLFPDDASLDRAWISAADRLLLPGDNVAFPDPATLACPDPARGAAFERGLSEDRAARLFDGPSVTFVFDQPSDGDCATLDGGLQDLATLLAPLPDRSFARVCLSSRYQGAPWQGCGMVRVRQRSASGLEPRPSPEGE